MISSHLSDLEIRQYALDKSNCDSNIIDHIEACVHCQAEVKIFQLILSEIENQPKPGFDFNLSGLVLSQLVQPQPVNSFAAFFPYLLVCIGIAAVSLVCYLFSPYFFAVFSGLTGMGIYLVLATTLTILIFQGIETYKKYQRKIDALNFY